MIDVSDQTMTIGAQTTHTRRAYDRHARFYDALEWPVEQLLYRRWRKALWQRIEGPEVIEIGVGTGKNVPYYPEGVQVTAVDLSEGMLARARRALQRHPEKAVALYLMDAERLDFDDDTFDEAVATFVFCSVPDPRAPACRRRGARPRDGPARRPHPPPHRRPHRSADGGERPHRRLAPRPRPAPHTPRALPPHRRPQTSLTR
jgi:SAM-dependent methyltransferase